MPPPFRTSQIGSLIRPAVLTEARKASSPDLPATLHASIKSALSSQLDLRFTPLSNGEFSRTVFWDGLFESDALTGLTATPIPVPPSGSNSHPFRPGHPTLPHLQAAGWFTFTLYIATGPIRWTRSAYLPEWESIKRALFELAPSPETAQAWTAQAKLSITALSREHFILADGQAWTADSGYTSAEQYLGDLANAWRAELVALYEAGLRHVNIDDPQLTFFLDAGLRAQMKADGTDVQALLKLYVDASNEMLRGLPEDLHVGMHLCRGNTPGGGHMTEGSYEGIARALFVDMQYETLYLEYDTDRAGGFEPLRFVPRGKNVVLGVVSTKSAVLEDVAELEERVMGAAAIMGAAQGRSAEEVMNDQIGVSPQCGFSSSSEGQGKGMTEEIQWQKLKLVQDLAKKLWPEEMDA